MNRITVVALGVLFCFGLFNSLSGAERFVICEESYATW
jgi:hypothetical protein